MKEARKHLRSCINIYKLQADHNRCFLHEHPAYAKSWKEPEMIRMIRKEKNILARIDQCRYGLWVKDKLGGALAKKPTKFLTNSPCVAEQLMKRCMGKETHKHQRHASLVHGRAKQAQIYPKPLCVAICRGIKEQIYQDKRGQFMLATIHADNAK